MAALSRAAGRTSARLRSFATALLRFLFPSWYEEDKYRPEHHYMRGPGPKWRAKHLSSSASSRKC